MLGTHLEDVIGLVGVGMILLAFYRLNTEKYSATHFSYQILNLVGSLMILYSLLFNWNTPSVIIEFFWIYISVVGLWRCYKRSKHKRQS